MNPQRRVYILGGAQTDFMRNWTREGLGIGHLLKESFLEALCRTELDPEDVDAVHIGNFLGEVYNRQGLLGGLLCESVPELRGKPSYRHEGACASGGLAVSAGMMEIESGRSGLVAVAGAELMRTAPTREAAIPLNVAAWYEAEKGCAELLWPYFFNKIAERYQEQGLLREEHLRAVREKNFSNARLNPLAQARSLDLENGRLGPDHPENPVVEGLLHRYDCSRITDGACVLFLASEARAGEYCRKRGVSMQQLPSVLGSASGTVQISFDGKTQPENPCFPHLKMVVDSALRQAGIRDIFQIDCIETHDCFSVSEFMVLDHFGITPPGKNFIAVEEGWIRRDGRIPVNPGGGLLGTGHPVGASGVRMVLDASLQTRGKAGETQIEGAGKAAVLNFGGSTTACVSFIIGTD